MARRQGLALPPSLASLQLADSLPACRPFRSQFGDCKLATLKSCLVEVRQGSSITSPQGGGSQSHDALEDCGDLREVLAALADRQGTSPLLLLRDSGEAPGAGYTPMARCSQDSPPLPGGMGLRGPAVVRSRIIEYTYIKTCP